MRRVEQREECHLLLGGPLKKRETREYRPAVMFPTVGPSCTKIHSLHSRAIPTPPVCPDTAMDLGNSTQLNPHCGHCQEG